jgi:hypothetical protein
LDAAKELLLNGAYRLDVVSFNAGSGVPIVTGFDPRRVIPVKPIERLLSARNRMLQRKGVEDASWWRAAGRPGWSRRSSLVGWSQMNPRGQITLLAGDRLLEVRSAVRRRRSAPGPARHHGDRGQAASADAGSCVRPRDCHPCDFCSAVGLSRRGCSRTPVCRWGWTADCW